MEVLHFNKLNVFSTWIDLFVFILLSMSERERMLHNYLIFAVYLYICFILRFLDLGVIQLYDWEILDLFISVMT